MRMLKHRKKVLSSAISAIFTFVVCNGIPLADASDIEIYKTANAGKTSIFLMLDTSGSMGISSLVLPKTNAYGSPGDVDSSLCAHTAVPEYYSGRGSTSSIYEWAYNLKDTNPSSPTNGKTSIYKSVTIGGTVIPYYVRGCTNGTITQYDRLSRLKDAILPLLASDKLSNDTIIGLGQFSSKTELTIGTATNTLTDGHSGRVLVPNGALTSTQRVRLAQTIASIKSLDTTTNEDGTANANLNLSSNNYPDVTKASSGTPTAHAYAEAGAYMMGTGTGSGGVNIGKVSTIYDGYMVMQNGTDQSYFICVAVGSGTTGALGATVKQCINNWPGYDSSNRTVTTGTVNGGIYRPDGNGGWIQVTSQSAFKNAVGPMASGWETFSKLPEGWRYGGWMKVNNEPMDIEPIVGTVWGGYAGGTIGIVSYRTNPFLVAGTNDNLIGGFAYSATDSKKTNGSSTYIAGGSNNTCDGNCIYFLTDGAPNSTKDNMAQTIMNTSLTPSYSISSKPTGGLVSPTLQSNLFSGETGGWEYIGKYAQILNSNNNPLGKSIKTAVVGFGSSFSALAGASGSTDATVCSSINNPDAKNACLWGSSQYGNGGIYYAENSNDIANSIINFVKKVSVSIDPINTGSPTIPTDALNPTMIQPFGYYATISPTPEKAYQLWLGNINKYQILNGVLAGSNNANLLNSGILNTNATGYWSDGVKGQLPLLSTATNSDNIRTSQRVVYTNRTISGSTAQESSTLAQVNLDALLKASGSFNNDPNKGYWLNVLGYDIDPTTSNISTSTLVNATELRQLGSTMHSSPLLLTQSGTVTYSNGSVSTTNRDDYLLFGTTQGILHVVQVGDEAKKGTTGYTYPGGKEVFSFVPNEMMENQKDAFRNVSSTNGSLFYGIDAPWAAYTQYVANTDGSLTVGASDRSNSTNTIQGKQFVYGGLRMGGRSYYALDLSDITNPSLKFHINPDGSNIINASGTTSNVTALSFMGQSWSKPTIARVKFGGQSKLVMIVGGGYDTGYENSAYNQTNKQGAGIYMFDAENGNLLWWASANATSATDTKGAQAVTSNSNLQYSVVGQINAIDRDGDGYADSLYFGDLGGQVFRIDLNNATSTATQQIDARVVRLTNQHVTNGLSPRFYEMPSITVHSDATGNKFVAVSIASGNRSSPLANNTQSANDAVYVIYDNDVARTDLYSITTDHPLNTTDVTLQAFNGTNGIARTNTTGTYNGGWYYNFSSTAGDYKAMNGLYAVGNLLYVNTYYRNGTGITGACNSGVQGDSYVFRFCLPTGKCSFASGTASSVSSTKLGAGILGASLSMQTVNGITYLTTSAGNAANPSSSVNGTPTTQGLKQLRWYESQ